MNIRYDMISVYVIRPAATSHEILQLRRAQNDYMGGTWQTVRGTMEANETAWQAALRELKEETGLTPTEFYKLSLLEIFYLTHDETIWHCPAFCALVAADANVILNEEHDAARWLPIESAAKDFMWPAEPQAIAELTREIINTGPAKPYLEIKLP